MTEAQPAAAAAPAATAEVPQTFKVFAGNLAFATTDEALNAFFSKAGEVLDAHVVTRGMRSMGYGFVDYATLELAEKAVNELNKQELDGRTINVELARAREEGSRAEGGEGAPRSAPRRRGRGRGRGRGGFRGPSSGASASAAPAAAAGGAAPYQHQGGYRGYRGGNYEQGQGNFYNASSAPYYEGYAYYPPYQGAPRGGARAPRPGRRARQQEGDEEQPAEQQQKGEEVAHQEGGEGQRGGRRQGRGGFRRGRGRGPRSEGGAPAPAGDAAPASDAPAGEFRGRGRRRGRGGRRFERRPRDENQAPSATTLFIANLPYEMDEEGLLEVFKDYQPKQARIARANGRSKGFGFVQLETQEFQQKAAAEIDNTEVQGRILNVKPAVVDLSVQQSEPEAEATQSEAQPAKQ